MSKHHDPTLQDVAREAGVSLATASRVLNGSTRAVAPAYRDRVEAAALRIGYAPNLAAQAMARGMANVVALVVGDIVDPYFSHIAAGVSRAAREQGLLLTMAVTEGDSALEVSTVHSLRGQRPRAIVLAASRREGDENTQTLIDELASYQRSGGHICIIGPNETPFTTTLIANAPGAEELGQTLAARGYTRAVIAAGPQGLRTSDARVAGFTAGFTAGLQAGIAADAGTSKSLGAVGDPGVAEGSGVVDVIHTEFTRDGGYQVADQIDAAILSDPQTVIFAVNDVMAVGLITAMRQRGYVAGTHCGVAGFDDVPLAQDMDLTTVAVDLERLGEVALTKALKEPEEVEQVVLPTSVVLRGSTR